MSVVVQKYGGSSLADVEHLWQVADKVCACKREGRDVVVVVSAMGKTTDGLLSLARQVTKSPPRRELDMLVSTGERVSMALLSMAVQERGFEAVSFTGSQSGIITNDRHFDARIIEVRPYRIEDELAKGRVVIVAGFQGVSYRKEITTLGRGGSDTTAVALAAALGAERCEIYSDVEGVFTADPRVVPQARLMPEIGYSELEEMARAGAKVLSVDAVELARRAGIAIHARATAMTYPGALQTIVRDRAQRGERCVRAVASEAAVVRGLVPGGPEELGTLAAAAARSSVSPRDLSFVSGATGGASFHLSLANVPDWDRARALLLEAVPRMRLDEDLGSVSLIGDGIGCEPLHVRAALEKASGVDGLSTTSTRITLLVKRDRVQEAARACHELVG
ncbi:MAG: aspartate kinase [Deltaproteobacteria bacterium]|nr:aspartate kinase [Deltaproteobacteria bacterium]